MILAKLTPVHLVMVKDRRPSRQHEVSIPTDDDSRIRGASELVLTFFLNKKHGGEPFYLSFGITKDHEYNSYLVTGKQCMLRMHQ